MTLRTSVEFEGGGLMIFGEESVVEEPREKISFHEGIDKSLEQTTGSMGDAGGDSS
jgi:hypothetical protein